MNFVFALPDPAEAGRGGGTAYNDGLVPALRELGHQVDVLTTQDPHIPHGATAIIDGMLLPSLHHRLPEIRAADAAVIIHHVSAAAGRDDGAKERIHSLEAQMLPHIRRVIATSRPVATRLADGFGITATVIEPGARDLPRATPADHEPLLLSVGVLTRRKGHDRLLQAASRLVDIPWRLVIAGDSGREPAYAAELAAQIDDLGLGNRATLLADPGSDALERAWRAATIFVLVSRWEGYPAAVAEALRRGIPTVVSDAGDTAKLIPADAGAVVPHDDMVTYGKCLRRVLFDTPLRTDMANAAWTAGRALPDWTTRAREFMTAMEA